MVLSGFLVTSFPYILYKHLFYLFPVIFPFFFSGFSQLVTIEALVYQKGYNYQYSVANALAYEARDFEIRAWFKEMFEDVVISYVVFQWNFCLDSPKKKKKTVTFVVMGWIELLLLWNFDQNVDFNKKFLHIWIIAQIDFQWSFLNSKFTFYHCVWNLKESVSWKFDTVFDNKDNVINVISKLSRSTDKTINCRKKKTNEM